MGEIEGGRAEEKKGWEDSGGGKYSGDDGELNRVGVGFRMHGMVCMALDWTFV
jgi:hypothetical protein